MLDMLDISHRAIVAKFTTNRAAEVERVNRWQKEGNKFQAIIARSMDLMLYELQCERNRRLQGTGAQLAHHRLDSES